MNNFQTILIAIFLAFFVFGVLVFSGAINFDKNSTKSSITGNVIVWGTLPASEMNEVISTSISGAGDSFTVTYVQKNKDIYEADLIDAFAKDKGPDLFIVPDDMILENMEFISKIPYSSLPKATFQKKYIDGANILLASDGVLGLPLLIDPIVLYYNKNILTNESILYPPKTWDEIFDLSSKLIKKNKDGTIMQAMIALGQYDNVDHAKDIFSLLMIQSGSPIVKLTDTGYVFDLNSSVATTITSSPAEQILEYFLEFSNPSKESYTWNRSLPSSIDMFTSGKMAFYVGYASELFNIESVNPNLSFDVATIPQTKGMENKRTYGKMYTLLISKKSKNLNSAVSLSSTIASDSFISDLSTRMSIPSASRTLLNNKPEDPYLSSFYDSAIVSRTWLDPSSKETDSIYKELLENIISNRLSLSEALSKARNAFDLLINKVSYE